MIGKLSKLSSLFFVFSLLLGCRNPAPITPALLIGSYVLEFQEVGLVDRINILSDGNFSHIATLEGKEIISERGKWEIADKEDGRIIFDSFIFVYSPFSPRRPEKVSFLQEVKMIHVQMVWRDDRGRIYLDMDSELGYEYVKYLGD